MPPAEAVSSIREQAASQPPHMDRKPPKARGSLSRQSRCCSPLPPCAIRHRCLTHSASTTEEPPPALFSESTEGTKGTLRQRPSREHCSLCTGHRLWSGRRACRLTLWTVVCGPSVGTLGRLPIRQKRHHRHLAVSRVDKCRNAIDALGDELLGHIDVHEEVLGIACFQDVRVSPPPLPCHKLLR